MAYEPTVIFQDIRFIPLKQHSYSFRAAVHAQHLFDTFKIHIDRYQ